MGEQHTPPWLPALSVRQPWASLMFTPRPCAGCNFPSSGVMEHAVYGENGAPMVKQWETRSKPPASTIVGKRVLIHAAKRTPTDVEVERIAGALGFDNRTPAHLPFGAIVGSAIIGEGVPIVDSWSSEDLDMARRGQHRIVIDGGELVSTETRTDLADQRPFGDWSPGRWAWPLTDPIKFAEPIPYPGRQGVFYVPPEVVG